MLDVKIKDSCLILINDTYTGLQLTCKTEYQLCCTVKIVDERAFKCATATETLKDILGRYIGACFSACFREAYPDGVEYNGLIVSAQKVNDIIRNKIAGVLECSGIVVETIFIENLVPDENDRNVFEKMHNMKAGITETITDRCDGKMEWICTCGNINTGKFCTECGLPREKR